MVSSDYYIIDNSDIENKKLEAAKNHFIKGDYHSALKLYTGMLNTSISYKLYYEIGRCYYKLNEMLHAEEYLKKSIAIEDFKNPSYLYLGNIYHKKGLQSKAIENWMYAYAYRPDDESVCLNLATSYFAKNMQYQSVFFYEKYLKYAKEKGEAYASIKSSIDKCHNVAQEFKLKGERALSRKDFASAIEFLTFAVKNLPTSFDINYLLGCAYLSKNDNMHSMIYLKQALCIDSNSLDVLQKLSSVFINLGDYTAAYCIMRRLLPLVIHNQSEYLKIMQMIKELNSTFDEMTYEGHKRFADMYFEENNYHLALLEYENCIMLKEDIQKDVQERVERLKTFIYPEERMVKACMEKGRTFYNDGDYKTSNKYFSKILSLSEENSTEYKYAKSRIVNV